MTNIQTVKEDKTYQYAAVDFDDITFSIKVTGDNPGVNDPDGVDTDISSLANTVYFESTDAFAGSEVELSLQMNNVVTATGFQCDLYLPEGVTVPKDSDDFFKVYLSTERTTASKTNIFDCAMQPDGALRILCSSTKSATFSGISGEVATITLQLDESLQEGELPILLRNIVISDKNSNTYKVDYVRRHLNVYTYVLGDVNNDRDVNVGDITGTANAILGNPPANFVSKAADVNVDGEVNVGDITGIANLILYGAVKPGAARAPRRVKTIDDGSNTISIGGASIERGGQQTISVNLKNAVNACGLQFDLYLPEGISISKDEDEFYIMELSGRTTPAKTNIFDCAQQADGAYRILLGSTRSSAFSGNEGEICTLTIEASTDAPLGDYEVQVKNIVVSETNSDTYTTELYTFNLKVKGGTDQKCEKPTICYENGKLTFQCATEDAVCQSTIEDTDIKSYTGNEVELCVTYSISVYATKEGYEDSDVATATLCWIDVDPQTEGLEEDAIAEVKAMPALVQTVGGQVIVSGIADGTDVAVYGVNGAKEGSAISTNGRASILTNLTPGTVALVKIGGKSVKIVVKL